MIPNAGKLVVTTPSEREIHLARVFDAPKHLVFRAYTEPTLVRQWLGVFGGWELPICTIDLRPGGQARYVWRHANGQEMGMTATFQEIVPDTRIVAIEVFDAAWYAGEGHTTITFEEVAGKTTLTIAIRYDSQAIRDAVLKSPMDQGVGASMDALERALIGLAGERS